ncbi:outer membrane beta-barrel protein [Elusimicrobiota bacterium]
MRKILALLLLSLAVSVPVFAGYGEKTISYGGFYSSNLSRFKLAKRPTGLIIKNKSGTGLGFFVDIMTKDDFKLNIAISQNEKGGIYEYTSGGNTAEYEEALTYMDFSFMGQYYFTSSEAPISLYGGFGMYYGSLAEATVGSTDVTDSYESYDAGYMYALGLEIAKHVILEMRTQTGMLEIDAASSSAKTKISNLSFLVGVKF